MYPPKTRTQRAESLAEEPSVPWELHTTSDRSVWRVALADGATLFHIDSTDLQRHERFREKWRQSLGRDRGQRSFFDAWMRELDVAFRAMKARGTEGDQNR